MDARRHTLHRGDDVVPPGDVRARSCREARFGALARPSPELCAQPWWSRPQFAVQALGPSHLMTISSYVNIWLCLDGTARRPRPAWTPDMTTFFGCA